MQQNDRNGQQPKQLSEPLADTGAVQTAKLVPPSKPGAWTLAQIQTALSRPLPNSILGTRQQGGQTITYIPWYKANEILDKYAPGWTWEIRSMATTCDRLFITGRLTLLTTEGCVYREATGTELLKEEKEVWVGVKPNRRLITDDLGRPVTEARELAYGDPSSNAESMAFRRAAAKFGLGLYLYKKE